MENAMEHLKKLYANMSDDEIERFAISESKDLTDEAFEVFLEEWKKRPISNTLLKNIIFLRKEISEKDIFELADQYSKGKCPLCNKNSNINAVLYKKIKSYVLMTSVQKILVIGCDECIEKGLKEANTINPMHYILGFPSSVFTIPFTKFGNKRRFEETQQERPSKELLKYVKENYGKIYNMLNS